MVISGHLEMVSLTSQRSMSWKRKVGAKHVQAMLWKGISDS